MTETSKFIGPLIHFFLPDISVENELIVHGYIRKAAHFTEYGILALLTIRAMILVGVGRSLMRFLPALALVLLVASVDEFHQSFEPSRTASIYDVGIDLTGGIIASIAAWLYLRWSGSPPRLAQARG
jgi:VanZ family protein